MKNKKAKNTKLKIVPFPILTVDGIKITFDKKSEEVFQFIVKSPDMQTTTEEILKNLWKCEKISNQDKAQARITIYKIQNELEKYNAGHIIELKGKQIKIKKDQIQTE